VAQLVSVLLCTRNRPQKLERAVSAILASSYGDFELIVVDQSTDDDSGRRVQAFQDPRITYIRTPTVGLSRSRNIAIRSARSEIVVFTDDDCICDSGWLASIADEYQRDPTVMGVFGRVVAFGTQATGMFCPCVMEDRERRVVDAPAVPQVALGSGNNMSFRKEVFHQIGLFVETLGAGTRMKSGEDTEFTYRVLRQRLKCVYAPEALIHHDNWLSLTQCQTLARDYLLGGSAALTKFALRLDRTASVELARTAYYILLDKKGVGNLPVALGTFLIGCAKGVEYSLTPPPRLPATG
jgi:glycosyltransferase involved in cell wall biosynthesis